MFGHLVQPRHRRLGQAAHGIPVEIDRRPVVKKAITEFRERILSIERGTHVTVEIVRKFDGHRRFRTSQSSRKNSIAMVVSRYATPPPPVPGREPISRAAIKV